jgi:Glycosyltransferase family 87
VNARILALVAILCTLLPVGMQTFADGRAGWAMIDFRAYYCAALEQRTGGEPYFAAPLHACEATTPSPFYRASRNVTVPAPYPPYALALLAPLTFLPFTAAAVVWWLALLAAIVVAAWALSLLCERPFLVGYAAFSLSLGLTCFSEGNVMPLSVAAITVAALLCRRGHFAASAVLLAFSMIEPNIALPAALGFFAAFRKARVPLAVCALALLGISMLDGGVAHNVQYLTMVLPAHALSEVSRDNQFSLSTIVAAFGVADRTAVLAGSISYIVMVAAGVVAGLRLSRRYEDGSFAVLIPAAFALVGGTFVHTEAIAAALPAALLLYTRAPEYRSWAFFGSVFLLAVPWMFATSVALLLAPVFPVAYLTHKLWSRERARWATVALMTLIAIIGLFAVASATSHATPISLARPEIDPRLAEAAWRDFVLGDSTNRLAMWLLRLPTWIGLVSTAALGLALTKPRADTRSMLRVRLG